MVASTEFLTFAIDPSANVITQVDYAASAFQDVGFVAGIAQSDELNKVWRQSAFVTSCLTTLIARRLDAAVLDNGVPEDLIAQMQSTLGRKRLYANTNFYVATTGNNANDGLTVGTPWLTMQYAWDYIQANYDLNGFTATINVANGAYTAGVIAKGAILGQAGPDKIIILGNIASPSSVTVTLTAGIGFQTESGAGFFVRGFKISGTGLSYALSATNGGFLRFGDIDFGAMTSGYHMACSANSIIELGVGAYTISGDAVSHCSVSAAIARFQINPTTITLTGVPAFSQAFIQAQTLGVCIGPVFGQTTFVGTATGKRYDTSFNGVINTSGGGATFLPGSIAGTTATGGQYG